MKEVKQSLKDIVIRLRQREGLRQIVSNLGWLFFDKVFRLGFGLFVVAWVARYLGPSDFGHLNYAIAFTSIFSAIAALGLSGIAVRELINEPDQREVILGSVFFLKLIGGICALVLSCSAILFIRPDDRLSLTLVFIIALGFLFQSFDTIDIWFQSQLLSKYTVWARNSVFLIVSSIKVFCILAKKPLIVFAVIGTFEIMISAAGLLIFYCAKHLRIKRWRADRLVMQNLLKDSWPLILAGFSIMVYMRIDQVMIGQMMGDRIVGVYSAAVQLAEIWYFIPMLISPSIFPSILKAKKIGGDRYAQRVQMLYDLMAFLAVLIAVVVFIFSKSIISFLYGSQYINASSVLSIYIWAGIPVFLGVAVSQFLIAENLTKISFYQALLGCITNVLLNLILIPKYGMNGAAWATFISYFASLFCVFLFKEARGHGTNMLKAFNPFRVASFIANRRV